VEFLAKSGLLDESGKPFSLHIERVLRDLLPKLRRQFPALRDEAVITGVLEEAGCKIAGHEQRSGPIEKLHGYAWVTLRSVAVSRMRQGSMRIERATLPFDEGRTILSHIPSEFGSAEAIERGVLLEEILARLSPDERMVWIWRKAGFSSKEIAHRLGSSVAAVDTLFHRMKEKILRAVK
jgi:RNA polymerase sigma factor (sigma-70 family)